MSNAVERGIRGAAGGRCRIILEDPHAQWFSTEHARDGFTVHGRGYAFLHDAYFTGQGLVAAVRKLTWRPTADACIAALKELIPKLNGCWALVAEWPDGHMLAATDRLRTIPLFHAQTQGGLLLSSSVHPILDEMPRVRIADEAALEFLLAGYITGADTLYEGVKQLQSGEMLEYGPDQHETHATTHRYYRCLPRGDSDAEEQGLARQLEVVLDRVFSRYTKALAGRQPVVPLSGGLDSRLVAGMLRRHGVQDVLCFSYGVEGNGEAAISKQVAQVLRYDWRFVEYSRDRWAEWLSSERMRDYWAYASRGTSLPCFQDFPAVEALVAEGYGGGSPLVFLPGHMGDVPAGSHVPTELLGRPADGGGDPVARSIVEHHYNLWPTDSRQWLNEPLACLRRKIANIAIGAGRAANAVSSYQDWERRCRQALFIINSARAYEFHGAGFLLPLADYELMDLWQRIPVGLLVGRRLYVNTLRKHIFQGPLSDLGRIPSSFDSCGLDDRPLSGTLGVGKRRKSVSVRAFLARQLDKMRLFEPLNWIRRKFVPDRHLASATW